MERCHCTPLRGHRRVLTVFLVLVCTGLTMALLHLYVVGYRQKRVCRHEQMLAIELSNAASEQDVVAKLGEPYAQLDRERARDFLARFSNNLTYIGMVNKADYVLVYKRQDMMYFILFDKSGNTLSHFVVNN